MATQTGKLASAKPAATTRTALYRAPIDSSASGVLNMVSDGTAANVRVGVKNKTSLQRSMQVHIYCILAM